MLFLQILLIPFKIILKLVGFVLAAVIKFIGFVIMAFSHVCGWVTNILGGIIFLVSIFYTVCGIVNFGGLQEIELWWVSSIIGIGVGLAVATLSLWVELLGDQIHYWGESLWDWVCDLSILPC